MEINDAYRFLMRVRELDSQIMREELTIAEIKSSLLPGAIRYDKDKVMTSPEDRLPEVFARIDERERKVAEMRERKAEVIEEIDEALKRMAEEIEGDKGRVQVDILYLFYVKRNSLKDTADQVGYSIPHCKKMKHWAVENFTRVLKHDTKCQQDFKT